MERDCILSQELTFERTVDEKSDKYSVHGKGGLISLNEDKNIYMCKKCNNVTNFSRVEIPYACKLMFQEVQTMSIAPRIITEPDNHKVK